MDWDAVHLDYGDLFDSRDLLIRILNVAPIGIAIVMRDDKLVFWNRAAEAITGFSRPDITDTHSLSRLCGQSSNHSLDAQKPVMGRPRRAEFLHKDGRRVMLLLQWTDLTLPGGEECGLYVFQDVTENVFDEDAVQLVNQLLLEATKRIQSQANTDGLTGLLNHRAFQQRIRQEISRMRRHRGALSIIMFDVDHFKQINDTHGHQFGDKVLVAISETASQIFRHEDIVARYGGEEFVIVLPDTRLSNAVTIAERLRVAVEQLALMDERGAQVHITISCGVSCQLARPDEDDGDLMAIQLIQQADESLYQAKRGGRNRVVAHQDARNGSMQND